MLPAAARMQGADDFRRTTRRGRRTANRLLVLHLERSNDSSVRVGFVVGRAVGPAVVRNRVRRRLRHLMADRLRLLPPGASVVVRALPASAGQSSAALGAALDDALRRACGERP